MTFAQNLADPTSRAETSYAQVEEDALADPTVYDIGYLHPGYVSGRWYGPQLSATPISNAAIAADTVYFQPTSILRPVTISQVALVVGTQGVTLGLMGIYRNAAGLPTTLIAECNDLADLNIAANTVAAVGFDADVPLDPGMYWFASMFNAILGIPFTSSAILWQGGGLAHHTGSLSAAGVVRGGSSPTARLTVPQAWASGLPPDVTGATFTYGTNAPGSPVIPFKAA